MSALILFNHASMIMWLDNRNIATVFVDLNVTIFCCFFYSCLHHSNLADEMFYKQTI